MRRLLDFVYCLRMFNGVQGSLWVPYESESLSLVDAFVRKQLLRNGVCSSAWYGVRLVANELAVNALRHGKPLAGGRFCVRVTFDSCFQNQGMMSVLVLDGGDGFLIDKVDMPPAEAVSGRGLALAFRFSERLYWGQVGCFCVVAECRVGLTLKVAA